MKSGMRREHYSRYIHLKRWRVTEHRNHKTIRIDGSSLLTNERAEQVKQTKGKPWTSQLIKPYQKAVSNSIKLRNGSDGSATLTVTPSNQYETTYSLKFAKSLNIDKKYSLVNTWRYKKDGSWADANPSNTKCPLKHRIQIIPKIAEKSTKIFMTDTDLS